MEEQILDVISKLLEQFGAVLPSWVWVVFTFIGVLRFFVKPIMALIEAYVKVSKSTSDDLAYEKASNSKWYKVIVFVLDWFGSIKIQKK